MAFLVIDDPPLERVIDHLNKHGVRDVREEISHDGVTVDLWYLLRDNESGRITHPLPKMPPKTKIDYNTVRSLCAKFGVPPDGLYWKI